MTFSTTYWGVGALPRNAAKLVKQRQDGEGLTGPVIVSYVGETGFTASHVYCDSGRAYQWDWMADAPGVCVVVKPGVNALDAIKAAYERVDITKGMPILVDLERKTASYIVGDSPIRLWHIPEGTEAWQAMFP